MSRAQILNLATCQVLSYVQLPRQVGCSEIVGRIVEDLKDESEPYRRMVMETIDKACALRPTAHIKI